MRFLGTVCAVFVGGAIGIAIGYSTSYIPVSATPSPASVSVYEDRNIPIPLTVQMRGIVVSTDVADGTITFDAQDPHFPSDKIRLMVRTTDSTEFRRTVVQKTDENIGLFGEEQRIGEDNVKVGELIKISVARTPGDLQTTFVLIYDTP